MPTDVNDRESLIKAYLPLARGHAKALANSSGCDADDLHQEAVLALCEGAARWNPKLGEFRPYVARAIWFHLMNVVTKHARSAARKAMPIAPVEMPGDEPDPDRFHFLAQQVRESISKCNPEQQRVTKALFGLDGGEPRSLRQIAAEMGIGTMTVQRIAQKAREIVGCDLMERGWTAERWYNAWN
jgi:RNA polymerase sigma factor (sigma-70 family)